MRQRDVVHQLAAFGLQHGGFGGHREDFRVRSDLKGLGLGWALMQRIIAYARSIGLKRMTGEVLRENTNMLRMAEALGFEIRQRPDDRGIVYLSLSLDGAAAARAPDFANERAVEDRAR